MADVVVLGQVGRDLVLRTPALPGLVHGAREAELRLGSLRTDTSTEGWA